MRPSASTTTTITRSRSTSGSSSPMRWYAAFSAWALPLRAFGRSRRSDVQVRDRRTRRGSRASDRSTRRRSTMTWRSRQVEGEQALDAVGDRDLLVQRSDEEDPCPGVGRVAAAPPARRRSRADRARRAPQSRRRCRRSRRTRRSGAVARPAAMPVERDHDASRTRNGTAGRGRRRQVDDVGLHRPDRGEHRPAIEARAERRGRDAAGVQVLERRDDALRGPAVAVGVRGLRHRRVRDRVGQQPVARRRRCDPDRCRRARACRRRRPRRVR